jgi:hypothetical protein
VRRATRIHRVHGVHAVTLTVSYYPLMKERVRGEGEQEVISNNKGNSVNRVNPVIEAALVGVNHDPLPRITDMQALNVIERRSSGGDIPTEAQARERRQ